MDKYKKINDILAKISQYNGTEMTYKLQGFSTVYTQGIHQLINRHAAYWLIIEVMIGCFELKEKRDFFSIRIDISKQDSTSGDLVFTDSDNEQIRRTHFTHTDFPINGFTMLYRNGVIFLPSEY